MGKAIYCDRCGKLFDTTKVEMKEVTIVGVFDEDLKADLCIDCARNIEEYIYGDDVKSKKH